jgi:hypothetical protein
MPVFSVALAATLALGSSGCIKKTLTNGQIASTRQASGAFDTIGDYELARSAASAGLVQFEGMHRLAPENTDALYLLAKGWAGYALAFPEDDYEAAYDEMEDDLAEYHQKRAKMAYERAIFYGLELLSYTADGFEAAKKDAPTLRKWLADNFKDKEDAANLFWVGYPMLARVNLLQDNPEVVAELYMPVAILERSRELDPTFMNYGATTALAAYHARSAMAEMDLSKQMFDEALAKTEGRALVVKLNYATKYACKKMDRPLYERLLNEVLAAEDPDPQQRLANTIAKRKAARAIKAKRMMSCGFDVSE